MERDPSFLISIETFFLLVFHIPSWDNDSPWGYVVMLYGGQVFYYEWSTHFLEIQNSQETKLFKNAFMCVYTWGGLYVSMYHSQQNP